MKSGVEKECPWEKNWQIDRQKKRTATFESKI